MALVVDLAEEFTTCIEIKDCGDAHGAEEADEEGLSPLFNLVDAFVHGEDNGKAAEQEDEDGDEDESVDRDNIVMREAVPGANSTVPGEDRHVEEHIDGGLEGIVFRLEAKPVACRWSIRLQFRKVVKRDLLPGEDVAGDKACKDIVAAEHTERADDEELHMFC